MGLYSLAELGNFGSRDDDGLCVWTLRFKNPEMEKGFMQSRTERLVAQSFRMAFVIMVLCSLIALVFLNQYRLRNEIYLPDGAWVQIGQLVVVGLVWVAMLFHMVIIKPRMLSHIGLFMRERIVIAVVMVCMLAILFGSRFYLAKL